MRYLGLAFLFFAPWLASCVHYAPAAVSSVSIDSKYQTPVSVVTGESEASYFLIWGPFGDDSLLAAYNNARSKDDGDSLVNVIVDRKLTCFPHCNFSLYTTITTVVHGTLVRYVDETGKRLGAVTPQLAPAPGPRMGRPELNRFFQGIPIGSWVEIRNYNETNTRGLFKSYSEPAQTVSIVPSGAAQTEEIVISLYVMTNARLIDK